MKHKSFEQIQHQIRQQFENSYKERLRTMQSMFQLRYQSLHDAIATVFQRLRKDELLATMINDRITSVHIDDRIKQIFGEVVAQERELIFKKMGTQIANLKFQNEELSRQIKRLKESTQSMEKDFCTERQSIEQAKNSTTEQLRRLRQQSYTFQAERKIREKQIDNIRAKLSQIEQENQQMRQLLMCMKDTKEAVTVRDQQINNYKIRVSQMQQALDELKYSLQDNQQKFERKYNNKKKQFKQKIQEYKAVITQLRNQRQKVENNSKKMQEDVLNANAQKRITQLIKDHERKISQIAFAKQKQQNELERKHQYKIKQIQDYFQKLLQNKIIQIQQNTNVCYDRMNQDAIKMQKYLQQYEQNSIPIAEFQEEINKRDEVIQMMKQKLTQFESTHHQFSKNQEHLLIKLRETETLVSDYKQKLTQSEQTIQQIVAKIKVYEQANNIFKINEKKNKDQFEEYERLVKKHRQDYQDSKRMCIRLQQQKSQIQVILRQKQRKMKTFNDQIERMQIKIKRMSQQSESNQKQRHSLVNSLNESKKQITNLQFKLKDQELNNSLQMNSWQNKLSNAQMEFKQKNNLLLDLQTKYQQICNLYQQEKRKNYDMQNQLKKTHIQNSYFKQSDQIKRNQQKLAVQQLKKLLIEKNQRIQSLQSQSELQRRRNKAIQIQNNLVLQQISQQNKHLKVKIAKLNKVIQNKLQTLRKQGRMIKEYLQGRQMVFKNDEDIFKSTLTKQLIHLQITYANQRQAYSRKTVQECKDKQTFEIKQLKNQFNQQYNRLAERSDNQKKLLMKQLKEKQMEIDNLNRSIKKNILDLKKQKQTIQQLQKQRQFERTKLSKQRQTFEIKLQQVIKEMKDQKDSVIREYSQNKTQMEQEIQNLVLTLKKLKSEVENIQLKHQQEKSNINSQLRTVKEQQETVQKIVSQKDKEIQKHLIDIEQIAQAKRGLQNQLRAYIDTVNKKIQHIHQLQLKQNQISADYNLIKTKSDRILEQNSELKRKMSQLQQELQDSLKAKIRIENQLKQIRGALNRSSKNQQLRSLNELSMETLQLSQKVNQMRKVSAYLDSKTPLRS